MAALAGSLEDVGATLESRARDSPDLASLGSFAQYLADTGETERALETFERALQCCCSLGDPVEVANAVPFASPAAPACPESSPRISISRKTVCGW